MLFLSVRLEQFDSHWTVFHGIKIYLSCRENRNTRFVFSNFFSENLALYEIMWTNLIQLDGPQMGIYRIYSRNSRHRVIHAFNTIFKKNYRYNQIYLRKIVSSHKSRTLNLDTKFWLKKCVNYASKYGHTAQKYEVW